jgi:hypothetical protein
MSRTRSSTVLAALMICVGTMQVSADSVASRLQAISTSCHTDVQTFCQGLTPGGGKVVRCLGQNVMSVSAACRGTMLSAMNDVCGQDISRLCPGVSANDPAAGSCLQAHAAELKGTCKSAADRLAGR